MFFLGQFCSHRHKQNFKGRQWYDGNFVSHCGIYVFEFWWRQIDGSWVLGLNGI